MIKWLFFLALSLNFLLLPEPASAHAFGKLYNLPVPFWMYLYGGAAAIVVSFLIIGYFINKTGKSVSYPTKSLSNLNFLVNKPVINIFKSISVFLFLLTILTGLFGEDSPYSNFNMTFFWIIFILGFSYLTAFVGNIFALVNPWKVLTEWFENITGEKMKGMFKYPQNLGYYPALLFYFLFIWIELFAQAFPRQLSLILIQYSLITFVGVMAVGKENWFKYCEFFSVFFRLIGKIAPLEYNKNKLYLRPPFIGLVKEKAEHFSLVLFILFMLSSTAFDGFRTTTPWVQFYWQNFDEVLSPIFGEGANTLFQAFGLLASPFVFLLIYVVLIGFAKFITKSKISLLELCLQFALPLVPVAFVYNVAHYYTLLLTEGQNMFRIISDPFGFGWNLFNTAKYEVNLSIIDANFTWHFQVALILVGHIVGTYLAHVVALKVFPSHKKALLSQFPLLLLMVVYTMIGLWILSQPITSEM
jgi:hypothetical protein